MFFWNIKFRKLWSQISRIYIHWCIFFDSSIRLIQCRAFLHWAIPSNFTPWPPTELHRSQLPCILRPRGSTKSPLGSLEPASCQLSLLSHATPGIWATFCFLEISKNDSRNGPRRLRVFLVELQWKQDIAIRWKKNSPLSCGPLDGELLFFAPGLKLLLHRWWIFNTYQLLGVAGKCTQLKHQQKKTEHWRYLEIPWGKNSIQFLLCLWELDLAIALETNQPPTMESLALRMLTNVSKMRSRLADRPHKFQALLQGSLVWILIDPDVTTSPSCRFSEVGVSQLLYFWDGI